MGDDRVRGRHGTHGHPVAPRSPRGAQRDRARDPRARRPGRRAHPRLRRDSRRDDLPGSPRVGARRVSRRRGVLVADRSVDRDVSGVPGRQPDERWGDHLRASARAEPARTRSSDRRHSRRARRVPACGRRRHAADHASDRAVPGGDGLRGLRADREGRTGDGPQRRVPQRHADPRVPRRRRCRGACACSPATSPRR